MRTAQLPRFLLTAALALSALPSLMFAQANLTKEVMEKKGTIVWKTAPANAIPQDVCSLLDVCAGATKLIALPRATEGGIVVGRGLFLTENSKHMEAIVLVHQTPADTYYFLVGPDGNLAKAAYAQVTSTSWQQMGTALSKPTFDKDKDAWEKQLAKLGGAPAAAEKKSGD